jgi:ribosomal protein S18 acetylase RimI-like enzyme
MTVINFRTNEGRMLSPETLATTERYAITGTGGIATISFLGDADLMDVLTLQEVTRAALPEQMKMFVLPQTPSYFEGLLAGRGGAMIGIRAEGKLIGQLAVVGPMELRDAIRLQLISKNDVLFHHAAMGDQVSVIKSLAVHPDWRGNEHSRHLLSFALDTQAARASAHVFAQISAGNRRSWEVFLRMGFGVVAAVHDAEDGKPRLILQRPLFGFDFVPEILADEVDPKEDFNAIAALTEREALDRKSVV